MVPGAALSPPLISAPVGRLIPNHTRVLLPYTQRTGLLLYAVGKTNKVIWRKIILQNYAASSFTNLELEAPKQQHVASGDTRE